MGSVGIGTDIPTETLSVAGVIESTIGGFKFPDGSIQLQSATPTGGVHSLQPASPPASGAPADAVYADNRGNVGIGTMTPQEKLTLSQDSNFAVEMETPTLLSAKAIVDPQGNLSDGTYFFKIVAEDGAGGTTAGSNELSCLISNTTGRRCALTWTAVQGATQYRIYKGSATGTPNQYQTSPTNTYNYDSDAGATSTSTSGPVPTVTTAYVNKLSAKGSSWFLGGNLGIGTSNPVVPLQIKRGGVIYLHGAPGARVYYFNNETPDWAIGTQNGENTQDFNIYNYSLGAVALSVNRATNHVDYPSSRRLKTNIESIDRALEKVQRLRGVTFDWKNDRRHDIGLVAEEVGEVIPEIVTYEENGKDAQGLDYSRLVAVLIEAVKEQQGQIEELKAAVKSLTVQKQLTEGTLVAELS